VTKYTFDMLRTEAALHNTFWAVLASRSPTPFEAAFVCNLSRELSYLDPPVPVHVMLDETELVRNRKQSVLSIWRGYTSGLVAIHAVTQVDIDTAFPSYRERRGRLGRDKFNRSVMWRMHEYALLTLRHLRRVPPAHHYWVSEADVFFKGAVGKWVEHVQERFPNEDVLPLSRDRTLDHWPHREDEQDAQPALLRRSRHSWFTCSEHVRRFSRLLLDKLFALLSLDVYVWGEAFAPSLCHNDRQLHCSKKTHAPYEGWPNDTWVWYRNGSWGWYVQSPTPPWKYLQIGHWFHRQPAVADKAVFELPHLTPPHPP